MEFRTIIFIVAIIVRIILTGEAILRYRNPIHIGLKDINLKKYTSKVIRNIS